ncbi:lipid II:glycine glycyltransferase FemX [Nocardioides daphniae]|uniref:Peptidoglycan bridge formation protein FemAB n=1 Tax=Nocardioides daphniae TaxID=402297 RepID=A0ABQ1Q4A1_9ACTN|nr:peptidoglycan bridge formation glycyltransferase FemA/FemB family protein [Nocardioides daphniae]GGD11670.1 peptidoglycan bridge formation protein FemAB [Nocardioides daphniae]
MSSRQLVQPLTLRPVTAADHLAFIRTQPSASFLQVPAWGPVKSEWQHESLGWFRPGADGEEMVGAALVLYRQLPKVKRYLAYLPEGPVLDWASFTDPDARLADWLEPLRDYLKTKGAFGIRIGPPVVTRRWSAAQIKEGVSDPAVRRLDDIAPLERTPTGAAVVSQLHELGWQPQAAEGGFAAGQPQYNFHVPLTVDGRAKTEDEVLKSMNQLWRRNIKKAAKEGVEVTRGTRDDLAAFHALYVHTAERDHFTPRPLAYFEKMWDSLTPEEDDRFVLHLARHEGDLVAATISIRVGQHSWYSYGASSTEKREVRGSNAVQWEMIRSALAAGAAVYDMRGITDTLDADDPHVGLIQFKVGTGGEAVEYVGEWDLPINRAIYAAFQLYMKRR